MNDVRDTQERARFTIQENEMHADSFLRDL